MSPRRAQRAGAVDDIPLPFARRSARDQARQDWIDERRTRPACRPIVAHQSDHLLRLACRVLIQHGGETPARGLSAEGATDPCSSVLGRQGILAGLGHITPQTRRCGDEGGGGTPEAEFAARLWLSRSCALRPQRVGAGNCSSTARPDDVTEPAPPRGRKATPGPSPAPSPVGMGASSTSPSRILRAGSVWRVSLGARCPRYRASLVRKRPPKSARFPY